MNLIEDEFYERMLPALRVKKNYLKTLKITSITEKDIWHYFCYTYWENENNLTIDKMVDDILNIDNLKLCLEIRKEKDNGTNNSK